MSHPISSGNPVSAHLSFVGSVKSSFRPHQPSESIFPIACITEVTADTAYRTKDDVVEEKGALQNSDPLVTGASCLEHVESGLHRSQPSFSIPYRSILPVQGLDPRGLKSSLITAPGWTQHPTRLTHEFRSRCIRAKEILNEVGLLTSSSSSYYYYSDSLPRGLCGSGPTHCSPARPDEQESKSPSVRHAPKVQNQLLRKRISRVIPTSHVQKGPSPASQEPHQVTTPIESSLTEPEENSCGFLHACALHTLLDDALATVNIHSDGCRLSSSPRDMISHVSHQASHFNQDRETSGLRSRSERVVNGKLMETRRSVSPLNSFCAYMHPLMRSHNRLKRHQDLQRDAALHRSLEFNWQPFRVETVEKPYVHESVQHQDKISSYEPIQIGSSCLGDHHSIHPRCDSVKIEELWLASPDEEHTVPDVSERLRADSADRDPVRGGPTPACVGTIQCTMKTFERQGDIRSPSSIPRPETSRSEPRRRTLSPFEMSRNCAVDFTSVREILHKVRKIHPTPRSTSGSTTHRTACARKDPVPPKVGVSSRTIQFVRRGQPGARVAAPEFHTARRSTQRQNRTSEQRSSSHAELVHLAHSIRRVPVARAQCVCAPGGPDRCENPRQSAAHVVVKVREKMVPSSRSKTPPTTKLESTARGSVRTQMVPIPIRRGSGGGGTGKDTPRASGTPRTGRLSQFHVVNQPVIPRSVSHFSFEPSGPTPRSRTPPTSLFACRNKDRDALPHTRSTNEMKGLKKLDTLYQGLRSATPPASGSFFRSNKVRSPLPEQLSAPGDSSASTRFLRDAVRIPHEISLSSGEKERDTPAQHSVCIKEPLTRSNVQTVPRLPLVINHCTPSSGNHKHMVSGAVPPIQGTFQGELMKSTLGGMNVDSLSKRDTKMEIPDEERSKRSGGVSVHDQLIEVVRLITDSDDDDDVEEKTDSPRTRRHKCFDRLISNSLPGSLERVNPEKQRCKNDATKDWKNHLQDHPNVVGVGGSPIKTFDSF